MNEREFEIRLRDLIIPHILYLSRYTTGLTAKTLKRLNTNLVKAVQPVVAAALAKIDDRGINMSAATRRVVDAEIKKVRVAVDKAVKPVTDDLLSELTDLAGDEAAFVPRALRAVKKSVTQDAKIEADRIFREATARAKEAQATHDDAVKAARDGGRTPPSPPKDVTPPKRKPMVNLEVQFPTRDLAPKLARAIVETSPMSGRHLKSWADRFSQDTQDRIEAAIRNGLSEAKTSDQIVRDIVGTRKSGYTDGIVLGERRRDMEALVRTAVNHVHNVAAQMSYAENDDVVKGWKYLATLDYRTTKFCASRDGKKYELGKGPIPPNHVRCRSISQPITLTMRELGVDLDEGTPLTRASMNGPVSGDETYDTWLRKRSVAEQEEYLGPTRYRAFKTGKLKLQDMVADDGRTLTLKELRDRHPDAF